MATTEFAWRPDDATVARANWTSLLRAEGMSDFAALERRAAEDPEWFWAAIIRHLDFRFDKPYTTLMDASNGIPFTRWCNGGTTNLVLNALDKWQGADRTREAIVWEGEDGALRRWTVVQLDIATSRAAAGLSKLGIGVGDVVGLYMPMLPETVAAFLAIVKVGAVALPLFSGFGADAIASRLLEGEASAVFTVDSTLRRAQIVQMKSVLDETLLQVPGVRNLIVVPRFAALACSMASIRDRTWQQLTEGQPDSYPTAMVGNPNVADVHFWHYGSAEGRDPLALRLIGQGSHGLQSSLGFSSR